jgi:exodeoxyribonuclease-5
VQGGRERGLILHKLMEEVLTGETPEAEAVLTERAADLIRALGRSPVADPATGCRLKNWRPVWPGPWPA